MAGPVVSRAIAPDRYWQLRHLVSEALRAQEKAARAYQDHLAAQAKVDALIRSVGLDPEINYTFDDAAFTLTPQPTIRPAAVAPPVAPAEPQGARGPLDMLKDDPEG
jgi:hypothetical protein